MKNQLKRSRVLNGVLAGALALVVVGSTAVVGAVSNGFQDWGRLSAPVQVQTNGTEEVKSGFEVSNVQENGIRLMSATIDETNYEDYGISPLAESAVTLTATITPSDATYKQVDWSVRWKNASSTWASGKTVTEYVTVATTTDGAGTATVSCLKAFGEQIEVVATARDNTTRTATCTVDYRKRITGLTQINITDEDEYRDTFFYWTSGQTATNTLSNASSYWWDSRSDVGYTATYSNYTIDQSYDLMNVYFLADEEIYHLFEDVDGFTWKSPDYDYGYEVVAWGNFLANCFEEVAENSHYVPTFSSAQEQTLVQTFAGYSTGDSIGQLTFLFSSGNNTYTKTVPVVLGEDCTKVYVTGLSLNKTSYVF